MITYGNAPGNVAVSPLPCAQVTTNPGKAVLVGTGAGLSGVTALATGSGARHSCAIAGGTLFCWGKNDFGQLGDGTNTNRSLPVAVPRVSAVVAATVSAQNTCAVLANGQVWCWGDNSEGQLGIGTTIEDGFSPVQVSF